MKKNFFKLTLITVIALFTIACNGGDPQEEIKAKADFTYAKADLTVTFTDQSTNAVSHEWNFGDGKTSSEKSPIHTYAEAGNYEVSLVATSETGHKSTKKETISLEKGELVKITLDGNFSDWNEVPAERLAVATLDEANCYEGLTRLKEIKLCANDMYIYLYVKMDKENANAMDIYLNTDGKFDTGYNSWMWYPHGANYLMQSTYESGYDMRLAGYDESKAGGWGWLQPNIVEPGSGLMTISDIKTVSGNIVEFEAQIIREFIPGLGNEVIVSIGHSGVAGDAWSTSGGLPTVTAEGDKQGGLTVKLN